MCDIGCARLRVRGHWVALRPMLQRIAAEKKKLEADKERMQRVRHEKRRQNWANVPSKYGKDSKVGCAHGAHEP